MPPQCFANDMWIGYGPRLLSERKVTIMEMICASPCITTPTCMTMEARYDADKKENKPAAPLDSTAQGASPCTQNPYRGRWRRTAPPAPLGRTAWKRGPCAPEDQQTRSYVGGGDQDPHSPSRRPQRCCQAAVFIEGAT